MCIRGSLRLAPNYLCKQRADCGVIDCVHVCFWKVCVCARACAHASCKYVFYKLILKLCILVGHRVASQVFCRHIASHERGRGWSQGSIGQFSCNYYSIIIIKNLICTCTWKLMFTLPLWPFAMCELLLQRRLDIRWGYFCMWLYMLCYCFSCVGITMVKSTEGSAEWLWWVWRTGNTYGQCPNVRMLTQSMEEH